MILFIIIVICIESTEIICSTINAKCDYDSDCCGTQYCYKSLFKKTGRCKVKTIKLADKSQNGIINNR